jgi:hypothetical protein
MCDGFMAPKVCALAAQALTNVNPVAPQLRHVSTNTPSTDQKRRGRLEMASWLRLFPIILCLVFGAAATGWFVDGFYSNNEASIAVKFRTYDLVLMILVIPLGVVMYILAGAGRVAPKVLMPGVLICLAFSYGVNTFNCHQNQLFLVYIAIFSMSAVAGSIEIMVQAGYSQKPTNKIVLKGIAVVLLFIALSGYRILLSDAVTAIMEGDVSPETAGMNLPVSAPQVLDLAFTLPLTIFGAIRLWQLRPIGLAISAAMLVFYVLISASVATMEIALQRAGYATDPGKLYAFGTVFILSFVMTALVTWELGKEWADGSQAPS